jgi:outer membrane immunogenic protein
MNCVMRNSRTPTTGRRRVARLRVGAAALGLILLAPVGASAADLDDSALRGSFSNMFSTSSYSRWDGFNFGAHIGLSNMNTDFGNSTSSLVAFILRNSTLENEAAPSNWTTLPSNTTNGRAYGVFLGYNYQWEQLVLGFDLAYNRPSTLESSASDSISRTVTTSDGVQNDVTIAAQSSLKLVDYATLRGRAGYAFGQFLPYAVLGVAAGRFNYTNTATVTVIQTPSGGVPSTFGPTTDSNNKDGAIVAGFVTGLGLDVAILPNMFLRAEWEFIAFAPVSGIRANINTGRVGIGLKF